MEGERNIKRRNVILVYIYTIITLGIYGWYWSISTKNDINSKGEYHIPTAWIWLIPIIGILYWNYKYYKGLSTNIRQDNKTWLWFIMSLIAPLNLALPAIIQTSINKKITPTETTGQEQTTTPIAPQEQPATTEEQEIVQQPATQGQVAQ